MSWKGRDRRAYPRVAFGFALELHIEVGVSGSTTAQGVTVNISRGGTLAAIDRRLPLRARCSIRFVDAADRVQPLETRGRIIRLTQRAGDFLAGIQFDEPLETLKVERTLWRKPRIFGRHR